jgi:hypothetical protein
VTWRAGLITILAIVVVARLTLTSAHQDSDEVRAGFTCIFGCNNEGARDVLSNILLFIPLGWALSYWFKPGRATLLCVVATVTIETLQGTVLVGRDSSLRDILANAAGGALGVWLFLDWRSLIWPRPRGSAVLGSVAALTGGAVLVISGLATALAPSGNVWFGLWAREYGLYTQYLGKVVAIETDGAGVPAGEMPEPIRLRDDMRGNNFLVRTRVVSGPEPKWSASIFSIVDKNHDEQLVIAQDRFALIFQVRTRYEQWEFRPIIAKLTMFPGRAPGDTVTIEAGRSGGELLLRASTDTASAEVRIPLTVGLGWAAMLPFRYALQIEWMLMNPLWLAGLIFPMAYWFGRGSPTAGAVATVVLMGVGLGAIPLLTGAAPTAPVEWIGSLSGAFAGWGLGVRSRRRPEWSNRKGV